MNLSESIAEQSDRLALLIEERLGIRGDGLETKLRKAGRLLPRWLRQEASRLVAAQRLVKHPKLMRQADSMTLEKACKRCEKWLKSIDPAARRRARLLNFLALNAANLLLVTAMFVAYLVWSGRL